MLVKIFFGAPFFCLCSALYLLYYNYNAISLFYCDAEDSFTSFYRANTSTEILALISEASNRASEDSKIISEGAQGASEASNEEFEGSKIISEGAQGASEASNEAFEGSKIISEGAQGISESSKTISY